MDVRRFAKGMALLGVAGAPLAVPVRPLVFVGESMSPTYANREVALTIPFRGHLERGDVVVIRRGEERIVKRVARLPGEVYTQFMTRSGWMDLGEFRMAGSLLVRLQTRTVLVPEGKVYVLGDNASESVDSRQLGPIDMSKIERVVLHPKPRP